jgi:hypothetical protein
VRVKLQHKLQPSEHSAHSVILEDDMGNPIFVALQVDDRIIYGTAGEPDFQALLKALGVDKQLVINDLTPKPIENMLWDK